MLHQTKEERVAHYLREGIIAGQFPRGMKLKQAEIAQMIGISITPVREAIKLLEAEGFVISSSHRGAVVAPFDVRATEEIVDLRIMLESKLALGALERLTQEDIKGLLSLQSEFEITSEKNDREGARPLNFRFHELIYQAADMPLTLRFVRTLWARYPFDMINKVQNRINRAAKEHRVLLNAIVARDEAAMLVSLREHIRAGWDEFKSDYSG